MRFPVALALVLFTSTSAQAKLYEVFTDLGTMYLETYETQAPISSENFDQYVNDGFYGHTLFHRVVSDFVIQGGGYTTKLEKKETRDAIANESRNGLNNVYGSVALARFANPDSATSQFYINLKNNPHLDATEDAFGYTVFARINCGMQIAEAISKEDVRRFESFTHLPQNPIRVIWIKPIEADNNGYAQCQRK
jgi:peptidyl-prolyl cis-trans isomerase A (cyclophilin A)